MGRTHVGDGYLELVITADEELRRVLPIIQRLSARYPAMLLSIDTTRAATARAAILAGAHLVNDVSGALRDPLMLSTCRELGVPLVLMHMRGNASTMQSPAHLSYSNLLGEIQTYFSQRVTAAVQEGIPSWNIFLDPGLGFSKQCPHNLAILRQLSRVAPPTVTVPVSAAATGGKDLPLNNTPLSPPLVLRTANLPLLVGPSRKGKAVFRCFLVRPAVLQAFRLMSYRSFVLFCRCYLFPSNIFCSLFC